jgi:hypothetical protein
MRRHILAALLPLALFGLACADQPTGPAGQPAQAEQAVQAEAVFQPEPTMAAGAPAPVAALVARADLLVDPLLRLLLGSLQDVRSAEPLRASLHAAATAFKGRDRTAGQGALESARSALDRYRQAQNLSPDDEITLGALRLMLDLDL